MGVCVLCVSVCVNCCLFIRFYLLELKVEEIYLAPTPSCPGLSLPLFPNCWVFAHNVGLKFHNGLKTTRTICEKTCSQFPVRTIIKTKENSASPFFPPVQAKSRFSAFLCMKFILPVSWASFQYYWRRVKLYGMHLVSGRTSTVEIYLFRITQIYRQK